MKWNVTSVSAACIVIGVGGFLLGKISSDNSGRSEGDRLAEKPEPLIHQRSISGNSESRSRVGANRPTRPTRQKTDISLDQKMLKMEQIVRGENALDRSRAMLDWIESLAPQDFEAAVARFRSLGLTEARMGEYAMLLTAWAEADPISALDYTTKNTTSGMATNTVLSAWASNHPEAAIAWAKANHQGDEANPYMAGIIRGLASTDPTRATALLTEMPFSAERADALEAMIPHLLQLDSEDAKKWIADLSDERLKGGAVARYAKAMAKQDPAGTAFWLMENLTESSVRSVDDVYREWARADSVAALANFEGLPAGDARSRALRGMVMADATKNPQTAASLMNRFREDVTDGTVHHFIWNSFEKAPDVATQQIGLIQDEGSRNRMYARALDAWLERDQAAAQRWIDTANLPASVIESLGKR